MIAVSFSLTETQYAALHIWIKEFAGTDDATSYVHPRYSKIDDKPHEWDLLRADGRMVITGGFQAEFEQYSVSILISDPAPDFAYQIVGKLLAEGAEVHLGNREVFSKLPGLFEE